MKQQNSVEGFFELDELPAFDPYDLWMTPVGVRARDGFYKGRLSGKLGAILIGLADWLLPTWSRRVCGAKPRLFPITLAQWVLTRDAIDAKEGNEILKAIDACAAIDDPSQISWGLGFPWMSKNGLYDIDTPFVTHTPYVMEALLHIAVLCPSLAASAMERFDRSHNFLCSLKVMAESADSLALSYAPVDEPRIVVNANSYAALGFALHYSRQAEGHALLAETLREKTLRLVNWIVTQQQTDGHWFYYADQDPGNFIDCFHSCFVMKNLLKVARLLPECEAQVQDAVAKGMAYLKGHFRISDSGLMRRFTVRDIKDPFVLDLYDQAEYLGMLVDLGEWDEAQDFHARVEQAFARHGQFYAKIDFLNRRWGCGYLRWGVMPYLHQLHRLGQGKL